MFYCIVNPSAKSGKGKKIWEGLEDKFKERGLDYKAVFTKGPGHATKLAKSLTTEDKYLKELPVKIVVLGGDGTLNEVMNGIADFEKTLVGYIPIGSSNDFARDLSYPKDFDALMDTIVKGEKVRSLDLGKLSFLSMTKPMSRLHDDVISNTRIFDVSSGIETDGKKDPQKMKQFAKEVTQIFGR